MFFCFKNSLEKLAKCLQLRSNYLQNINKNEEISLKEIKQLQTGTFKCSDTLFIKINPKLPSSYVNHRYLKGKSMNFFYYFLCMAGNYTQL